MSGRIVVIGHRLAANDLSGHLLEQGGWKHLKLVLVAETTERYPTRDGIWVRKPDKLLRHGSYSPAQLRQLRAGNGVPDFETVFQQAPSDGTFLLQEEWFPLFTSAPRAEARGLC